ncbi:MAG TPA: tripartite tricarboxylate transporter substrate-binding protein [Reyranella sp.]|nr:tripartite tricarboxylate transporter substrate-binding protein [Reyranella sp.]
MIELGRRAAVGGALAGVATAAEAAEWPSKTSTWIVGFPAGGPTDAFARPVAAQVAEALGQTVVVDNRAGASGTIAATQAARAPADGYTMLVGFTGFAFAPIIYPKAGFDLLRDFAPISAFARVQSALVVNPERLDVKTLQEFIAVAKAKPESIDTASPGLGTVPHLAIVNFQARTGVLLHHVPYRGGAPALQDLLAGNVAASFASIATLIPQIKAGKLRALAIAGRRREPLLPDVPTMDEAGLKDFRAISWFGLFAPKRTPAAILDRLHGAVQKALTADEVKRVWAEQAAKVELESRADFTRFVGQEVMRWSGIARAAGVQME